MRHHVLGLALPDVSLAVTTGSSWLLDSTVAQPSRRRELLVLSVAERIDVLARPTSAVAGVWTGSRSMSADTVRHRPARPDVPRCGRIRRRSEWRCKAIVLRVLS
jgi:hypothetical protein